MLVDERLAAQQMTSGAKTGIAYTSLSQAGIQLTTEPFFKSMLVALYIVSQNPLAPSILGYHVNSKARQTVK